MTKKIKTLIVLTLLGVGYGLYTQFYSYDNDKACEYVTNNALDRSHTCCAWFVMRAMQVGGCPIGILPAWAYQYALPLYGFDKVYEDIGKDCSPKCQIRKGDIVVIPKGTYSFWGHVAMYDGNRWVSDFKQNHMSPYKKQVRYRIYRRHEVGSINS